MNGLQAGTNGKTPVVRILQRGSKVEALALPRATGWLKI